MCRTRRHDGCRGHDCPRAEPAVLSVELPATMACRNRTAQMAIRSSHPDPEITESAAAKPDQSQTHLLIRRHCPVPPQQATACCQW